MAQHSLFSASASARWIRCPGSLALCEGLPNTSSSAAWRGTVIHALSEECLRHDTDPATYDELVVDGIKVEIDEEMIEIAEVYVEFVRGLPGAKRYEVRSDYSHLLPDEVREAGESIAFGTVDAMVLAPDGTVYVIDLKTGRRWVDPKENTQLGLYAAGIVRQLEEFFDEKITSIQLVIIQPVLHKEPQVWEPTRAELSRIEGDAMLAAMDALEARKTISNPLKPKWINEYLQVTPKGCDFCPAASFCPALEKAATDIIPAADVSEFDMPNFLEAQSPEQLNARFAKLAIVSLWSDAVAAEMMRRVTRGDQGLSQKLVAGREGNRKFSDDEKTIAKLKELGVPESAFMSEPSLRTPPQVEKELKRLKRAKDMDALADCISRSPAKPTMAHKDDPRPAWSEAAGADEFDAHG